MEWGRFLLCLSCFLLTSCGGVKRQNQVAQALQTMLTTMIEGNLQIVNGNGSATEIACGLTNEEGSFSFGAGFTQIDPQNPGDSNVSFPVTFNNCKIKACAKDVRLNGSGASVNMAAADLAAGETKAFVISFIANHLSATGIVEGELSFGYNLRATASRSLVNILEFSETTPAQPLIYLDFTYHADRITELADGC